MATELEPRSAEHARCSRACRCGAEELGRAVLPLVFERIRGLTREIEARTRARTGPMDGGGDCGGESFDPWDAAQEVREAGFLLGVIAGARGIDLFSARREEDGLRAVVRWTGAAVGARIEPSPRELPLVATARGGGWEIPLLGACLFLRAARLAPAHPLRWRVERHAGVATLALPRSARDERDDRFLADLALLVPGAEALVEDERFGFRWPSAWLAG